MLCPSAWRYARVRKFWNKYTFFGAMLFVALVGAGASVANMVNGDWSDAIWLTLNILLCIFWISEWRDHKRKDAQKKRWAEMFKYDAPNYKEW